MHHIKKDGCIPFIQRRKTPSTYFWREFAGGSFPIHVSEDEYDEFFKEHPIRIEKYETHTIPQNPSEYTLCIKDEDGKERKIRNTPRN